MKKISRVATLLLCAFGVSFQASAGNKDRSGQAGATELLINPWGRSTGVFGLNTANVRGIDALKTNVAGLAMSDRTEIGLSHTRYLSGAGVSINNLGFAQQLGSTGVLGVNVMSMGFGEIPIVDYNNPEGEIGTYTPQFFNFQVAFAKQFSNSIQAGVGATFVSEQVSNIGASGMCFEAGIQYVTGKRDNFHFGITLRNIGTNMRFSGSGFAINGEAAPDATYEMNRFTPAEKFEMPTYLNFGLAYDFYLDENRLSNNDTAPKHRATVMGGFTSNSFNNDQFGLGVEYAFKEIFMVRGGYRYEKNIGTGESTTIYSGFSAGASVAHRLGENGPRLAIDYSFRPTQRPANGVHVFSLRFMR